MEHGGHGTNYGKGGEASLEGSLVAYLDSIGISLSKVSGISTDGAAVMVGATNGVVGRLRQRIPHVVSVHCIAHRFVHA
ncbi:hypothetical protein CLOP_g3604 [Closterium sp. NIES-67]|nr:hypothetical protein CLOP_g3604 [Closterium sp. NIES-67]